MIALPLAELRALGQLDVVAGRDRVTGVVVDSRRVKPGDLFVAVGRGVEYVADARSRGAAATLVADDAHAALAAIARLVRERSRARVVGITGSTGKTSTKDILFALAARHAPTVAAEEGFNNEIGLPLTVARLEPETKILIAEMGMRGLGQIAALCAIARPHVGVITGVGPVHLELLGTVERVAQAKAEIVHALPPGGTAVVPAAARALEPFLGRTDIELVRFGEGGDVRLAAWEPPRLVADVGGRRIELTVPFTARYQADNMLAALAAYTALDLPLERVAEGASEITFSRWRGAEVELAGGILLVNDAYNANPVSMRAAIRHLRERAGGRRTVAVLGPMAELGEHAARYHAEIAAEAAAIDVVIAVGEAARAYLGAGGGERRWVSGVAEAVDELRRVLEPGDVVLLKASRAYGLERVQEELTAVPA